MIALRRFGTVFRAEWHASTVAVKMLKRSDSIAMHDFRSELDVLQKARPCCRRP